MTGSNIWNDVLSRIETKVNRHIFYTWFKPTSLVGDDGATLEVQVPNGLFRDWLTKHYAAVLDEALGEVDRTGTAIVFITDVSNGAQRAPAAATSAVLAVDPAIDAAPGVDDASAGGLAPRYSFDACI